MNQTWKKRFLASAVTAGMVVSSLGFGGPGEGMITAMAAVIFEGGTLWLCEVYVSCLGRRGWLFY